MWMFLSMLRRSRTGSNTTPEYLYVARQSLLESGTECMKNVSSHPFRRFSDKAVVRPGLLEYASLTTKYRAQHPGSSRDVVKVSIMPWFDMFSYDSPGPFFSCPFGKTQKPKLSRRIEASKSKQAACSHHTQQTFDPHPLSVPRPGATQRTQAHK